MNWNLLLPLLVTALVTIVGWIVVDRLSLSRERISRRLDRRIEFLLQAYRHLEKGANPREPRQHWDQIETAIADIQLLGSHTQVQLAERAALDLSGSGGASLDALSLALRDDLGLQLGLERLNRRPIYLRFIPHNGVNGDAPGGDRELLE